MDGVDNGGMNGGDLGAGVVNDGDGGDGFDGGNGFHGGDGEGSSTTIVTKYVSGSVTNQLTNAFNPCTLSKTKMSKIALTSFKNM